jgi:hypothetical protein
MNVFDYFTIGSLDVHIDVLSKSTWEDINEAMVIFKDIEDVGWRLHTLGEIKFLHENKSEIKIEMGHFWFLDEDAIPRVYVEDLGVWKVNPNCKFPAIMVKDSIVNSEEL